MKKISIFLSCMAAAFSLAANDAADFQNTVKMVDSDGVYLNYVNVNSMLEIVSPVLSAWQKYNPSANCSTLESAFRKISSQAAASSSKKTGTIFTNRAFMLRKTAIPAADAAKQNVVLHSMQTIPADAVLACGVHLDKESVLRELKKQSEGKDDVTADLEKFCRENFRKSLAETLDMFQGECFLYLTVPAKGVRNAAPFRLIVSIPDAKGELYRLIVKNAKGQLMQTADNCCTFPILALLLPGTNPMLQSVSGRLVFSTEPGIDRPAASLGQTAEFSAYCKGLPPKANAYLWLNSDERIKPLSMFALQYAPALQAFIDTLGPYRSFTVCREEPNGLLAVSNSNLSCPQAAVKLLAAAASLGNEANKIRLAEIKRQQEKAKRKAIQSRQLPDEEN